ncbi:MAG: ribonuclease D [Chthoniobacterales bacterium]
MIADAAGLEELLDRIADLPVIAFDTEADSLHCYFEKLCLIQISTPSENVLVDPLADVPLQPLLDAVSDKRVVFHGADYDLRMLRRVGSFEPREIFDTMIASRLCGVDQLGLGALVEKHFGVQLSKSSQKANWARRPLPPEMIDYAINDTRYLLELASRIEADLHNLGRWQWFVESRDRMVAASREVKERDAETIWRISGSARLAPRAQSVLRVLWFWRDAEARAWNRPPFHVAGNEDLLRISECASAGKPFATPRMTSRRRRSFEVTLALALQVPESEWPREERKRGKRRTNEQLKRFDELKAVRDTVAAGLNVDPSIIAPRGALEAISIDVNSPALMQWQRQLIGLQPLQPA